jgi:hypothetical protein
MFAIPGFLGPYLAGKRNWLSPRLSLARSIASALPLLFVPIGFLLGMAGWGDFQEHLVRGILHATRKELPDHFVGVLIVAGIVIFGATAVASLIWISVSILTKKWRSRTLLILWTGCLLLAALFFAALARLQADGLAFIFFGLLLVFFAGFLLALGIVMNATARGLSIAFRVSLVSVLVSLAGGMSILLARSVPEKRFPTLESGPLWTSNIASAECSPDWGGPNSSAAPNEIAFATKNLLGMAFETNATPLPQNKWAYKSCLLTMDALSGAKIAQLSIDGGQPIINGRTDGLFEVRTNGLSTTYAADLKQVGTPQEIEKPNGWTAAKWHSFRSDSHGKLWFDQHGGTRLLAQLPCDLIYIHPLGEERVLVTGCRQFSLYRSDGSLLSTETFTREGANLAALSADHRRFALAVYLWGVGDPSYLEEEKIIVYDAETGNAIVAVPSEPLPRMQSWAALSPDGTLLAVGAQNTLRLFRLSLPIAEKQP